MSPRSPSHPKSKRFRKEGPRAARNLRRALSLKRACSRYTSPKATSPLYFPNKSLIPPTARACFHTRFSEQNVQRFHRSPSPIRPVGKLGHGGEKSVNTPKLIDRLKKNEAVTYVSAGGIHSAAITASGCVYTWGGSSYGQVQAPGGIEPSRMKYITVALGRA